jgi:hypothetical protein
MKSSISWGGSAAIVASGAADQLRGFGTIRSERSRVGARSVRS